MSVGRILTIPGLTFNNPTAPKLVEVDLIESPGSLLLLDATHPSGAWAPGVPANAQKLKNVLWKKAQALYGNGTEDSLGLTLNHAGMSGTTGLLERSGKGGLHAMISQNANLVLENSLPWTRFNMSAELRRWLFQNPSNDLYISVWGTVTRGYKFGTVEPTYTGLGGTALIELATSGSEQRLTLGQKKSIQNTLGDMNNNEQTVGPVFMNGASDGWRVPPVAENSIFSAFIGIGNTGLNNTYVSGTATAKTRWPSWVVYRAYVEDLTVSGRTYQQVHEIDYALYKKHVLTEGGRYYGDTYTNPAVLP